MLKTELKLPFVFYTALNKQHRFRTQNLDKKPFGLISPNDRLLPFQILTPSGGGIESFIIYDLDDSPVASPSTALLATASTETEDYILYTGDTISTLANGCYYATVTKNGITYY